MKAGVELWLSFALPHISMHRILTMTQPSPRAKSRYDQTGQASVKPSLEGPVAGAISQPPVATRGVARQP